MSGRAYRGPLVRAFFDNLLPDNDKIRQRIQTRYGTSSVDAFDLLAEVGRDCVGAIQLLPESAPAPDLRQIEGVPLVDAQVGEVLAGVFAPPLGQRADDDFRISLAGAQEKTAILLREGRWEKPVGATPTTHIFKLPIGKSKAQGIDLTTSVENEWLCHEVLMAFGIPVARCEMATFGAQRTLIVERFDRRLATDGTWIVRLPQEDICQATGTPPGGKYEADGGPGIKDIMSLLFGSQIAHADRLDFFRTQIVFWLLCAIDGHAKNFSLFIEPQGLYRLTPRYDVISAYPVLGHGIGELAEQKVKMAMAVFGENRHYHWSEIRFRHWLESADACGLGVDARDLLEELIERTPGVANSVRERLPEDFPRAVAEPILEGLVASAQKLRDQANAGE
ncbi:MAG: type II toxin-antitoxin system HipA family toxin [Burkholderiales bacterium]